MQAEPWNLQADDRAKTEAGGVLLGSVGKTGAIEIHEYVEIPSAKTANGKYLLDVSQVETLRKATGRGNSLSVIGYFRTQSASDMQLRDDEIDLVKQHFSDSSNVVLLIQPDGAHSKAGFLFWSGTEFCPFSFMDFPLDAEQLRLSLTRKAIESLGDRGAGLDEIADSAPKEVAPQIHVARQQRQWLRGLGAAVVALLAVAAALSVLWWRNRPVPRAPKPATVAQAPAPAPPNLQLEVEARGNGVDIRWNPSSALIAQAVSGNLVVAEEGHAPETTPLDPAHLAAGHVYYGSSAGRFEIQLQVVDPSGKTVTDSVMMLFSHSKVEPPPVAAVSPEMIVPPAKASVGPQKPRAVEPAPAAKTKPIEMAQTTAVVRPTPPVVRRFTPPERARIADRSAPSLDPPAIELGKANIPSGVTLPETAQNPSANRLPPPPEPLAAEKTVPEPKRLATGGNLQAAQLIRMIQPVYPPAAQSARVEGVVRFQATIAKDGSVQALQLVRGTPLLVPSARDAVKQWVYRPAMLNGQPVEGTIQVDVSFKLNR
jgi:protein TonB